MNFVMPFIFRWLVNTSGLWMAIMLLGTGTSSKPENIMVFLVAGLVFTIINSLLKPLLIFLSLPALILTLGLFMIVVNGIMVYIALLLTPWIEMHFGGAVITGIILSLLNYVVSNVAGSTEPRRKERKA